MFSLLAFLIRIICTLFKSKKELIIQLHVYKKELEILKRLNQKKRIKIKHYDRVIFSILNRIASIKDIISIVKPETVILWQKQLIKRFWTYKTTNRGGRPVVEDEIKQLILSMYREFVRQQLIEFEQKIDHVVYMIHDHAAQFNLYYID